MFPAGSFKLSRAGRDRGVKTQALYFVEDRRYVQSNGNSQPDVLLVAAGGVTRFDAEQHLGYFDCSG